VTTRPLIKREPEAYVRIKGFLPTDLGLVLDKPVRGIATSCARPIEARDFAQQPLTVERDVKVHSYRAPRVRIANVHVVAVDRALTLRNHVAGHRVIVGDLELAAD